MRCMKRIFCMILALCLTLAGSIGFAQEAPQIHIYLDGGAIATGQLVSNRTLVPIRVLSENMGYSVGWDGDTQTVTVQNSDVTNVLRIGSYTASRIQDGTEAQLTLDVAPMIYNSRTYVPLRYITESLGCGVIWYGQTQSVYIVSPMRIAVCGAAFSQAGLRESDILERIGNPYDTLDGADGIRRLVYMHPENGSMSVFGLYENQLFEFFTNETTAQINGVAVSQMSEENGLQSAKVFYDTLDKNQPVAFYMNAAGERYAAYVAGADKAAVMEGEAKLTYYLTNSLRALAGKKGLVYSEALSGVDKTHVASMAENNFFAHEGLGGDGIKDRITAAPGFAKYRLLGEILAKMPNAYYACYGWLNSASHREAMLSGAYTYTGICVDGNPNENLYYAQVLVQL